MENLRGAHLPNRHAAGPVVPTLIGSTRKQLGEIKDGDGAEADAEVVEEVAERGRLTPAECCRLCSTCDRCRCTVVRLKHATGRKMDSATTDEEIITTAVYGAIAGIVLRGGRVNPRQIVAALDRVQFSLAQVRRYWEKQAEEHLAQTNLRNLPTEPVQVALTDLVREQIDGRWAYRVHKDTTAAKVFERNGWREFKRRYSIRHFVMPDGSEPPAHLTPVVELLVPARVEVVRLADKLHAARTGAGLEVDGLQVSYSPSRTFRTTNRSGKEYTHRRPAQFMMFKQCWLATATWERGDDKPPEWSFTGEGLPEPALRLVVERERAAR